MCAENRKLQILILALRITYNGICDCVSCVSLRHTKKREQKDREIVIASECVAFKTPHFYSSHLMRRRRQLKYLLYVSQLMAFLFHNLVSYSFPIVCVCLYVCMFVRVCFYVPFPFDFESIRFDFRFYE